MSILFERGELNGLILSNRFVRSATWAGLATDEGACTPEMTDLMAELADGGVGLIITGHAFVHPEGQHSERQLGIHTDDLVPGLQAMTQAVHERGGKIVIQLGYGGAYLSRSRVQRMTQRDIRSVIEAFGRAARRAREADFDGIQIFAAHGFFLSQLLSPRYNFRTDAYGGDIHNRARALMEVLQVTRESVGGAYPVLAKLNCRDMVENGLTLEDSLRVGALLEEGGIDAIELSGGLLNLPNLMRKGTGIDEEEVYFLDEARAFKQKIGVPLILVGGIRSYHVAERLLKDEVADYISLCRPFIREPDLVNRWKSGDLRRAACISCNNCVEQIKRGGGLACSPLEEKEAETFFPELSETLKASPPHPPGTSYQVAVGLEEWHSSYIPVVKVRMVHNGKVSNRAPSFPINTKDHERVGRTIEALLEKHRRAHGKQ